MARLVFLGRSVSPRVFDERLSRFLSNEQIGPVAVQGSFIPTNLARLGHPRWVVLPLVALPTSGILPPGWMASVVTYGHASVISLALSFLDHIRDLPPGALPIP